VEGYNFFVCECKVTYGYEHRQAHEKSLAINAVFVIISNPEVGFTNVSFGKKIV